MKICVRLPFGCAFVGSSLERPKSRRRGGNTYSKTTLRKKKKKMEIVHASCISLAFSSALLGVFDVFWCFLELLEKGRGCSSRCH